MRGARQEALLARCAVGQEGRRGDAGLSATNAVSCCGRAGEPCGRSPRRSRTRRSRLGRSWPTAAARERPTAGPGSAGRAPGAKAPEKSVACRMRRNVLIASPMVSVTARRLDGGAVGGHHHLVHLPDPRRLHDRMSRGTVPDRSLDRDATSPGQSLPDPNEVGFSFAHHLLTGARPGRRPGHAPRPRSAAGWACGGSAPGRPDRAVTAARAAGPPPRLAPTREKGLSRTRYDGSSWAPRDRPRCGRRLRISALA